MLKKKYNYYDEKPKRTKPLTASEMVTQKAEQMDKLLPKDFSPEVDRTPGTFEGIELIGVHKDGTRQVLLAQKANLSMMSGQELNFNVRFD